MENGKSEKDVYYELDDLQDMACNLDMMIQGYIYAVSESTTTYRMAENLRSKSFELQDAISKIQKNFNPKGETKNA